MIAAEDLILEPIEDLQDINGVQFPEEPKFRQFLITGPPGREEHAGGKNARLAL